MSNRGKGPEGDSSERVIDLLERLGAISLYLLTDMDHHSIAPPSGDGDPARNDRPEGIEKKEEVGMTDAKAVALLEDIKKLLILDLVSKGVQSQHIAHVLGVDAAVITRMVPARKMKKV